MFQFPIQHHSPVVYRLAIHLPEQHSVSFNPTNLEQQTPQNENDNIEDIRRKQLGQILNKNSDSTLMAWFNLNQTDENARQYLYKDIPKYYSYHRTDRVWNARRTPSLNVVGRIYTVHSKESERFAIRLLLNHVGGAKSFDELKTVDGVIQNTFREAAIARGLIENPQEAINCLNEAYDIIMNDHNFRVFFVQYLINCTPECSTIWPLFRERISRDILFRIRETQNDPTLPFNAEIYQLGLCEIAKLLSTEGYSLGSFPSMPQLNDNQINQLTNRYHQLLNFDDNNHNIQTRAQDILNQNLPFLNPQQRNVFDSIISETRRIYIYIF